MKRKAEEKNVVLFDTAKRCLLIMDHLYAELKRMTSETEVAVIANAPSGNAVELYVTALSLVDYFHRFREIISAMTVIRKDARELKKFKSTVKPVTNCRNYLQHMRNDLMKNDAIDYPILGAISWASGNRTYTVFSSQQMSQGVRIPGITYDRHEKAYAFKYMLVVGRYEVRLDTRL